MTPLPPSLEEAIREAARKTLLVFADEEDLADYPEAVKSAVGVLRSLVLRAQRETAERCGQIAQEQAHQDEGSAMQLDAVGHDSLADRSRASAAFLREIEAQIRKEYGLDD